MALSKVKLSGSTDGKNIKVTGTNTAGAVTIHTAHATALDEVYIYATNTSATDVLLTIEYGGTAIDDNIQITVPARDGLYLVVSGLLLTNSLVIKAFAGTVDVININGYVNRIA